MANKPLCPKRKLEAASRSRRLPLPALITERAMGFEPTTFSLARRRSTTELRPQVKHCPLCPSRDTRRSIGFERARIYHGQDGLSNRSRRPPHRSLRAASREGSAVDPWRSYGEIDEPRSSIVLTHSCSLDTSPFPSIIRLSSCPAHSDHCPHWS
jgi:hypothetical protein